METAYVGISIGVTLQQRLASSGWSSVKQTAVCKP